MGVVVCTVFSPRSVEPREIIETHLALAGPISRYVWLNNGGGPQMAAPLLRGARNLKPAAPVTLITVDKTLPIARAYNVLLDHAQAAHPEDDYLELQDDILVKPDLVAALQESEFDIAAGWHDNRPQKDYIRLGVPYVVGMACLIRNRVFRAQGFHDELFVKGVDEEYGLRASLSGWKVGHVYTSLVHHCGKTTAMGDNGFAKRLHEHAHALAEFLHDRGLLKGHRDRRIALVKPPTVMTLWQGRAPAPAPVPAPQPPANVPGGPAYAVVLLGYKRPESLGKTVAGVLAQRPAPAEVLLWNNAPSAAVPDGVTSITAARNFGCRARHALALLAAQEIVVFIDDDVWLNDPGVLPRLVSELERHPGAVVGTQGKRFNGDPQRPYSSAKTLACEDAEVDVVKGLLCAVRREHLAAAFHGALSPEVAGEDDITLCGLVRRKTGAKARIVALAKGAVEYRRDDREGLQDRPDHYARRDAACRCLAELGCWI